MIVNKQVTGRAVRGLAPCSVSPRKAVSSRLCRARSNRQRCSSSGSRSKALLVQAFKNDTLAAEAPSAGISKDVVNKVGVDQEALKAASQAYIQSFVEPLNRATLQVYKFHEDIFNQLLVTPDLDKHLKTNRALQWATQSVEAAVADAMNIAYLAGSRKQSSGFSSMEASTAEQSPNSSIDTFYRRSVNVSDGMGASPAAAAAPAAAPCNKDDDDEQCEVDWEELFASFDGAESHIDVGEFTVQHINSTASLDMSSDEAAAAAASKVEQMTGEPFDVTAAHLFLQRVLYKINRLNHFWFDDLRNYTNERSVWLSQLRDMIEEPWQEWEQRQMVEATAATKADKGHSDGQPQYSTPAQQHSHKQDINVLPELAEQYQRMSVDEMKEGLRQRYHADVAPPLSPAQEFVVNEMSPLGYCHLLAVGSLDGLVEASRQSRVCAGVANPVSVAVFRVLMEEYGSGRYARKHSTFYKSGMEELGLNTKEEHYLDIVPWQWLATGNHNFLLTERRRNYLRYAGALSFFEINGPSVYKTYLAASQRCQLSDAASGYWSLHIKEDERHGKQMVDEVAVPLVDMYPEDAWELMWGYDQDRFMGSRAGAALVAHIKAADALMQEDTTKQLQHTEINQH